MSFTKIDDITNAEFRKLPPFLQSASRQRLLPERGSRHQFKLAVFELYDLYDALVIETERQRQVRAARAWARFFDATFVMISEHRPFTMGDSVKMFQFDRQCQKPGLVFRKVYGPGDKRTTWEPLELYGA